MALLAISETIPMILIGPFAGIIIDRVDRKYAMIFANLSQSIIIGLIPFTAFLPNRIFWVFLLAFLNSTCNRFFFPARGASIPKLIDKKEDLFAANSLSAGAYQVSALIGPMLAGISLGFIGYDLPFIFDSISFIISAVFIFSIPLNLKADKQSESSPLTDLIEGGNFILHYAPILYLLVIFSILMFAGGGSLILIIPYLEEVFGFTETGPREFVYGVMTAMSASVGMTAALLLSRKKRLNRPILVITISLMIAGFMLIGFSLSPNIYVLGFFWIGFGTIEVLVGIPLQTLAQETVPDQLRGKTFSFINLSITISQILGMGLVGILAESPLGIRGSLFANGVFLLIAFVFGVNWITRKRLDAQAEEKRVLFHQSSGE